MKTIKLSTTVFVSTYIFLILGCSPQQFAAKHLIKDKTELNSSSMTLPICDNELKKAFAETYFPFLSTKCMTCHISGPGIGIFASQDIEIAFTSFEGYGYKKISDMSLNPNHQPLITGLHNSDLINGFNNKYMAAIEADKACKAAAAEAAQTTSSEVSLPPPPGDISSSIDLTGKYLKLKPKKINTDQVSTVYVVSWSIPEEVEGVSPAGLEGSFQIDMKLATFSGTPVGYMFSNPKFKMDKGLPQVIKGITFHKNYENTTLLTTYTFLNKQIPVGSETFLADNFASSLAIMSISSTNLLGIRIYGFGNTEGDEDPANPFPSLVLPTPKFSELISSNGVFTRNCQSCHKAGKSSAGLSLDNFTSTSTRVNKTNPYQSLLFKRAVAKVKPMPPSGTISAKDLEIIERWILGGAPP